MSCPPKGKPAMRLPTDPCVRLEMFEMAAFELAAGKRRTRVKHGEFEVEYDTASVGYLEREIARLRAICGKRSAITIGRSSGCHPYPIRRS